jgi:hypothetical protein
LGILHVPLVATTGQYERVAGERRQDEAKPSVIGDKTHAGIDLSSGVDN